MTGKVGGAVGCGVERRAGTDGTLRVMAWPARRVSYMNPFNKLLYDAVEATRKVEVIEFSPKAALFGPRVDVIHVHWPDSYLAASRGWRFWPRYFYLRALALRARLSGTKLAWTAHNLQRSGQCHSALLELLFWHWFTRRLDGVIFMTRASQAHAIARFPVLADTPQACIPHGDYLSVTGAPEAGTVERMPSMLFFGSVSRYKNVYRVLEGFLTLPSGSARLEIRGKTSASEPDERLVAGLAALSPEHAPHVVVEDRFLDEPELVAAVRGTDMSVFPYSDVQNSGAAIFALSAGRPILAADNALFRELQEIVGPEWVMLTEDWETPETLQAALAAARDLRAQGRAPDLQALSWPSIGASTAAFYATLARGA